MITGDEPGTGVFPGNVVACLGSVLPAIDEDMTVVERPLRPTDPNFSLGIFSSLWQPDENSYEMGHARPHEPTLQSYQIGVQTLMKDGDSVRGLRASSLFSYRVRSVLYGNTGLHVALTMLTVTDGPVTERVRRWGLRSQRFMNNDLEGTFVFVSTLDLWIETEMS